MKTQYLNSIQFLGWNVKNRRLTAAESRIILGPMDMKDAPEIRRTERFGQPAREEPRCPVCGRECESIYRYRNGEAVGCDRCLTRCDAWKEEACERNR